MHRDAVEDLDRGPVLDDQPLDAVEAVQLHFRGGPLGQVPAPRRGRASDTRAPVPCCPAPQDAVDGADRGDGALFLFLQRLLNRLGPEGAEVTGQPEFAADAHDHVLARGVRAPGPLRGVGTIEPIDPVQTLAAGTADPVGNGTDAEAAGDGAKGLPSADGGYYLATALGKTVCLLLMFPLNAWF